MSKHAAELAYWRDRAAEADLSASNALYERCFTDLFGIDAGAYAGKRMLDVGCGPRGSLEWADQAAERVGLDPLAEEYVRLHATPQSMTYVQGDAEAIPFPDATFDVVSTINSLDHVDDVGAAVAELTRVTRPGGRLLLLVDINHDPTPMEPHRLGWDFLDGFGSDWRVLERREFARFSDNMYDNVFVAGEPYAAADRDREPGVLAALLERAT